MEQSHKNDLISLENISFNRNSRFILKGISLKIPSQGITGILGPSGSGKSTMLKLMNLLISPTSGNIFYKQNSFSSYDSRELRKEIGLIQQRQFLS